MKKLIPIFFIYFLGISFCTAQKVLQKEISSEGIETVLIEDDAIFKIEVQTSENNRVQLKANISGENSESIIIEEKIQDGTLFLSTGFSPFFEKENDKLAAHKLMAVEILVVIPKHINIQIKSKIASATVIGAYKNVEIGLDEGNCLLKDFLGNAVLQTKMGDITVFARNQVSGEGISLHGTVKNELPITGKYHLTAETINGSISLLQTE